MDELLRLCREISLQGVYFVDYEYCGLTDRITVWVNNRARWNDGEFAKSRRLKIHNIKIDNVKLPEAIKQIKEYMK